MAERGILYVISAPSGAGKTSLVKALLARRPSLKVATSHTTRASREGEVEGINYFFVSKEKFAQMVEQDEFLEFAEVFGNSYGTATYWVEDCLKQGYDLILEIDWQGADQVRQLIPDMLSIFILPPSVDALRQRLDQRGKDHAEVIEQRMIQAVDEISHYVDYDYLVVNNNFEEALDEIEAILVSSRLTCIKQSSKLDKLLKELLSS